MALRLDRFVCLIKIVAEVQKRVCANFLEGRGAALEFEL